MKEYLKPCAYNPSELAGPRTLVVCWWLVMACLLKNEPAS